jgi:hypothetical protein
MSKTANYKITFYKIICNNTNITDIYIGHTTNFIERRRAHKKCCINAIYKAYNTKVYKCIRENGGWENWSMIIISEQECNDKSEACKIERQYIEQYNATLNNNIPSRTVKEYREANKDKSKEYYQSNKDKIKEYRENNKEKINELIKKYRDVNRSKINEKKKLYYENNKDKSKENNKKYRDANRSKIKEYQKLYREKMKQKKSEIEIEI